MGGEDKYPTNAAVLENGTLRVTMGDGNCLDAKIPNVYTTGGKVGGKQVGIRPQRRLSVENPETIIQAKIKAVLHKKCKQSGDFLHLSGNNFRRPSL
ncbi:hypothetical protein [Neisseria yangbaofengii]|uniref:hypothetical protein n=1 Tax=Neisseria yangbaofengii TaxID=2709396 RepID=UPI0013EBC7C4|nr:hypothetical protein [Neisseria yangbaofengii]